MRLKSTIFALTLGAFAVFGDTVTKIIEPQPPAIPPAAPQQLPPQATAKEAVEELLKSADAQLPAIPPAPPPPQEVSKPTAKDAAEELLNAVGQTGLLAPVTPEHAQEFQVFLLRLLNVPATLEKEAAFPKAPTARIISGTHVAAFTIPQFDDDIALELKKLAQIIDKEKPIAVLLNLSKSNGDAELPSQQLLEYCSAETTPIAVLFDKETKGMAETTLQELVQRKYLTFGEPSAGLPGARKAIPLSNGATLKYYATKSQPVKPQIDLTKTANRSKWPRTAADYLTFTHIQKIAK